MNLKTREERVFYLKGGWSESELEKQYIILNNIKVVQSEIELIEL